MGRRKKDEKRLISGGFTPMPHYLCDCPAYMALGTVAMAIYWRLRRLAGYDGRYNGEIFLSVRDAAAMCHVSKDTANRAFDQLQAKGFIRAAKIGAFGLEGKGKATVWLLTEFRERPGILPTKDFMKWTPGNDFHVAKKQNPVSPQGHPVSPQGQSGAQNPTIIPFARTK